jgi:hypothetical protein
MVVFYGPQSFYSVDANGDKNYGIRGVHLDWGVQVVDTRLDRRQLRWMESTGLDLSLASQPLEAEHPGILGGLPKMLADRDDEDLLSAMEGSRGWNNCGICASGQ